MYYFKNKMLLNYLYIENIWLVLLGLGCKLIFIREKLVLEWKIARIPNQRKKEIWQKRELILSDGFENWKFQMNLKNIFVTSNVNFRKKTLNEHRLMFLQVSNPCFVIHENIKIFAQLVRQYFWIINIQVKDLNFFLEFFKFCKQKFSWKCF